MATWEEISQDSFAAAKAVLEEGRWRSAISRLYYAGYSAITADLADLVTFARGWNNPSHEVLPALIEPQFAVAFSR